MGARRQELKDAELEALSITRIRDESVKIAATKMDFGKAVQSTTESEAAA